MLLGVVLVWFFFYLIGEGLLSLPTSFHEGTLWEAKWWDEEMKRVPRRQKGKGALELIEEAVHLLRTAPVVRWRVIFLAVCRSYWVCCIFGPT